MNIFVLHSDPKICAQYHCDKHVVKMIVETAQLLSNVHSICESDQKISITCLYKPTHINHPCSIWASKSRANYQWLASLGINLCIEYTKRYGKIHSSEKLLVLLSNNLPISFEFDHETERPLCMPEEYRNGNVVESYRNYYKYGKKDILKYKNGNIPEFIK